MCDIKRGEILVDSRHGQYCPQVFAQTINREKFPNISEESWNILLEGPDNEMYWDVWCYDVDGTMSIDGGTIFQDGDVWVVYEWDE